MRWIKILDLADNWSQSHNNYLSWAHGLYHWNPKQIVLNNFPNSKFYLYLWHCFLIERKLHGFLIPPLLGLLREYCSTVIAVLITCFLLHAWSFFIALSIEWLCIFRTMSFTIITKSKLIKINVWFVVLGKTNY